jgi:6-oxo-cyclohex-1-ene-carbonyl-CoA hydrolase
MTTTDEIIDKSAPSHLVDHNLVDRDVESLCGGMVRYEKRPAKRRDGSTAEGLINAWIVINNPKQSQLLHDGHGQGADPRFRRASVDRE